MNRIAVELDEILNALDTCSAEALRQKVREAIKAAAVEAAKREDPEFMNPNIDPMLGVENGYPVGYFAKTAGALAGEEFERPDQGKLPEAKTW